jgi:hypothetical protein
VAASAQTQIHPVGSGCKRPPAAQRDRLDHRPDVAQSCDYDERQAGKEQQPRTEVTMMAPIGTHVPHDANQRGERDQGQLNTLVCKVLETEDWK